MWRLKRLRLPTVEKVPSGPLGWLEPCELPAQKVHTVYSTEPGKVLQYSWVELPEYLGQVKSKSEHLHFSHYILGDLKR